MAPKKIIPKGEKQKKASETDVSRTLAQILDAVSVLGQRQGCTTREIVTQLKSTRRSSSRLGNTGNLQLVAQVRRGLQHGVRTGFLVQHGRRYLRTTNSSKSMKKITCAKEPAKNSKKNKRRRSSTKSGSETSEVTGESTDEQSHSRSRIKKKRPQRSHRSRGHSHDSARSAKSRSGSNNNNITNKTKTSSDSNPATAPRQVEPELPGISFTSRRSKRTKKSNKNLPCEQMDEDVNTTNERVDEDEEGPKCGNPDCLCSSKQDTEEIATKRELEPKPKSDPDSGKIHDNIN